MNATTKKGLDQVSAILSATGHDDLARDLEKIHGIKVPQKLRNLSGGVHDSVVMEPGGTQVMHHRTPKKKSRTPMKLSEAIHASQYL